MASPKRIRKNRRQLEAAESGAEHDHSCLHRRLPLRARLVSQTLQRPGCGTMRMYGRGALPSLRIGLLRVLVGDRAGDDDVFARLPVDRRRHLVRRGELQRVDHPQHLVEVPAGGHRVDDDQLDLLVGSDDEDVADRLVVRGGPSFRCPFESTPAACPYSFEIVRSVSPIIG